MHSVKKSPASCAPTAHLAGVEKQYWSTRGDPIWTFTDEWGAVMMMGWTITLLHVCRIYFIIKILPFFKYNFILIMIYFWSSCLKVSFLCWYSASSCKCSIHILIYVLKVILYLIFLIFFDDSEDSFSMKWAPTTKGTKYNILAPNL